MRVRVSVAARVLVIAALLASLLPFAAPAAAQEGAAAPPLLVALLTGAAEVPGPGDPDGVGVAGILGFPRIGAICFRILVRNITLPATGAHIHSGAAGVAGPIVVSLTAPDASGTSAGCVTGVDPALVSQILMHPDQYYVNVHTSDFPAGAIRGQLMRLPMPAA
jgi:hypothetical protein